MFKVHAAFGQGSEGDCLEGMEQNFWAHGPFWWYVGHLLRAVWVPSQW